eukprot:jgi/Botrbrau1/23080/Bobra.0243s0021.1
MPVQAAARGQPFGARSLGFGSHPLRSLTPEGRHPSPGESASTCSSTWVPPSMDSNSSSRDSCIQRSIYGYTASGSSAGCSSHSVDMPLKDQNGATSTSAYGAACKTNIKVWGNENAVVGAPSCCPELPESIARRSSLVQAFRDGTPAAQEGMVYARMKVGTALMGLLDRHRERRFHIAANLNETPLSAAQPQEEDPVLSLGETRSLSLSGQKPGKSDLKRLLDAHRKHREDLTGWQGPLLDGATVGEFADLNLVLPQAQNQVEVVVGPSLVHHQERVQTQYAHEQYPPQHMQMHPNFWAANVSDQLGPMNDALLVEEEVYSEDELFDRNLSLPSEADTMLRAYLARSLPASYKRQHPIPAEVVVPEPDLTRTSRRARSMEGYCHGGFATKEEERRHANYVEMMDRCAAGISGICLYFFTHGVPKNSPLFVSPLKTLLGPDAGDPFTRQGPIQGVSLLTCIA